MHEATTVNGKRKLIATSKLRNSLENQLLYRPRTTNDADFRRLVEGIRDNGIQSPLIVSADWYIISGHCRCAAALELGLETVPVIQLATRRDGVSKDEWIRLLRSHNTGREKTLDERIRENIVDINPDEAMRYVRDELVRRSEPKSETIWIPSTYKDRSEITAQTREFAEAIKGILKGILKDSLPVPERAIHYRLLPLGVRTSTGKAGFVYINDVKSSSALSRMLTRLRLCGEVPWNWICDETRPVGMWDTYRDAAEFIGEMSEQLYQGFARDLLQSQTAYHEILLEKLTVKGFIDKVAVKYTMPTVTMRGNSSIDARYRLAERFRASGKRCMVLFVLTDCDPAGDSIAESTVHSLRDEFDIDVKAIRVAMTHAQAEEYNIASSVDAALDLKASSVRAKFLERHGRSDAYELEAVSPEVLASLLDEAIRANIDIKAYNAEVELQAADVTTIQATRKSALAAIGGSL